MLSAWQSLVAEDGGMCHGLQQALAADMATGSSPDAQQKGVDGIHRNDGTVGTTQEQIRHGEMLTDARLTQTTVHQCHAAKQRGRLVATVY